jgi:hypothetical protein
LIGSDCGLRVPEQSADAQLDAPKARDGCIKVVKPDQLA